jgi:UDP-N-acetylglucosamine transferase subunit ALG13
MCGNCWTWSPGGGAHDTVFATEPTPLGASIAKKTRTRTFAHFAFGQRRTEGWGALLRSGLGNLRDSWAIVRDERPDVVVSSGAGSALFTVIFARARGAKVVVIESFARFRAPSLFGRMAKPFAHLAVVQSAALSAYWPEAPVCDPFEIVDAPRPPKKAVAFATVGTVLPFDRLIGGVAKLKRDGLLPEHVTAQVGEGGPTHPELTCVEGMDFADVQALLADAELVFTHGGTGSLVTALRAGCRVVAMARDPERREHYDDHQMEIVEAFAERGLIAVARDADDLPRALAEARAMTVRRATTNPQKLIGLLKARFPA